MPAVGESKPQLSWYEGDNEADDEAEDEADAEAQPTGTFYWLTSEAVYPPLCYLHPETIILSA